MNKVLLMGRLTRDPEVRYSNATPPLAVVRYSLAVNRQFKREGQQDVDFINCVAFGKTGEFAEKYFKKGMMIGVCGRLSVSNYEDKETQQKRTSTEVVVEDQYFAESKASFESRGGGQGSDSYSQQPRQSSFDQEMPIVESVDDDDLPF